MKKCYNIILLLILMLSSMIQAQKWTTYDYNSSNYSITASNCIAADASGNIWIGANKSIVKFDQNKTWTIYNSTNSGLPNDNITDIAVDASNMIWVCTYGTGFYSFNGASTWATYTNSTTSGGMPTDYTYCMTFDNAGNAYVGIYSGNSKNAGLMKWNKGTSWAAGTFTDGYNYKNVEALAKDKQGNIWCGTSIGVFKYDPVGGTFTSYTKENTGGGLCGNYVRVINVDASGNVWCGCMDKDAVSGSWVAGGLSKFNGSSWTNYKPTNSNLSNGMVSAIAFRNNDVWVGTGFCGQTTGNGLYKFDGTTWTNYVTTTSTFPGNCVNDIVVDKNNNVWIAGSNIVTKIDYTTDVEKTESLPSSFQLMQNYPNPFNPETVISYQLPASSYVSLKVYDTLGKEVSTLVNEEKQPGKYEVKFDASRLSSGMYFYKLNAGGFSQTKKMTLIK
jgi:ligand-binding sensor domain-containing protein